MSTLSAVERHDDSNSNGNGGATGAEAVLPESVPVVMPDLPVTVTVASEQQLKALGDATRSRILGIIQNQPATAKQIADNLHASPGTIGHHLQVLEEAGLAKVVARRLVRGIVAKYYTRTARIFNFDLPRELTGHKAQTPDFLSLARDEIVESLARNEEAVLTSGLPHMRLSPERAQVYVDRLMAIVDDMILETPDPEGTVFGMCVSMFIAPDYMQRVSTPPVEDAASEQRKRRKKIE